MALKPPNQFRKPEEYKAQAQEGVPKDREVFFRLRLMPAGLIQYAVEQVTLQDNHVLERRLVTERDILPITLSKIEDLLLTQIRR
jgi:hypothetical protein